MVYTHNFPFSLVILYLIVPTHLLVQIWHTISMKRNTQIIIIGVIVVAIVAIAVLINKGVIKLPKSQSEDVPVFQIESFPHTSLSFPGTSGGSVTIDFPKTNKSAVDTAITTAVTDFGTKIASTVSTEAITYQYEVRSFDDYLFLTLWNTDKASTAPGYKTFGFTEDGVLDYTKILKPGYEAVMQSEVATSIKSRMSDLDDVALTANIKNAIANHSFRIASNGVVVILSSMGMPSVELPYYEVVVAPEKLSNYLLFTFPTPEIKK